MISQYILRLIANKEYSDEHDCKEFANELKHLAEQEGERLPLLGIRFKDGGGHQANYYIHDGIWFFEPQSGENKIELPEIDFIELQLPHKGFHLFTYDNKDGWCPATVNNKFKYFNL